jgi:hypothetical protein
VAFEGSQRVTFHVFPIEFLGIMDNIVVVVRPLPNVLSSFRKMDD